MGTSSSREATLVATKSSVGQKPKLAASSLLNSGKRKRASQDVEEGMPDEQEQVEHAVLNYVKENI